MFAGLRGRRDRGRQIQVAGTWECFQTLADVGACILHTRQHLHLGALVHQGTEDGSVRLGHLHRRQDRNA